MYRVTITPLKFAEMAREDRPVLLETKSLDEARAAMREAAVHTAATYHIWDIRTGTPILIDRVVGAHADD